MIYYSTTYFLFTTKQVLLFNFYVILDNYNRAHDTAYSVHLPNLHEKFEFSYYLNNIINFRFLKNGNGNYGSVGIAGHRSPP